MKAMRNHAWMGVVLATGVTVLALACGDSTGPSRGVSVSPASRFVSIHEDSVVARPDSAGVLITGGGSDTVAWVATHGGGTWNTLTTSSGRGSGKVRWVLDAAMMFGGTYVDTITITAQGLGTARVIDTLEVREGPAQYIAVRRAWLPGERDAQIALVTLNRSLGAYSDLVAFIFGDSDSITVVGRNPLYPGTRASDLQLAPAFSSSWYITGVDLHQVDISHLPLAPSDTLDWLIVFWYNPSEPTYKGFTVGFSRAVTLGATTLNTVNFDANGGRAGAGGGEARFNTGEYWEASGGTMAITGGSYGAPATITSGVWIGGTQANGSMTGRLFKVSMPRVLPTPATNPVWTYDFRSTPIGAAQITCIFPTPCTGGAAQAIAALVREGHAAPISRILGLR